MSEEVRAVLDQRTKVYEAIDKMKGATDRVVSEAMKLRVAMITCHEAGDRTIQNDVDEKLAESALALAAIAVQATELAAQARVNVLSFATKAAQGRYNAEVRKTTAYRMLTIKKEADKLVAMSNTTI